MIRIDVASDRHPISPLVYGMNFAEENTALLGTPIHRNGGNHTTRYNWKTNADNRAADWYFQSIGEKDPTPSGRVDAWIRANQSAGAQSMVTLPLIGWTAKIGKNRERTWSFSVRKYGPQEKTDPHGDPDSGNGKRPDGSLITGNDPNDANLKTDTSFYVPWIEHLVKTFGKASSGKGVSYYLLDNEPALWHSTHRDVTPVGVRMDDLFARSVDMARAVKRIDPSAKVVGPEEWGWIGYFYSGFDQQYGRKDGLKERPDRAAHEGKEFSAWYLQQFAEEEKRSKTRLLDVFGLHFYPQNGEFSADVSPEMQKKRNRSTRAMWDTNYRDESWINDTVRLIPRMKEWVRTNYPGTKIAITEYNWGGDGHMNGATAQADLLGIFGREGLDIATRWTAPQRGTQTFEAIRLYTNYDGARSSFGETSIQCRVPNPDVLSAFAATRAKDGAVTVMVVSKEARQKPVVHVEVAGLQGRVEKAECWQVATESSTDAKITRLPDVKPTADGRLSFTPPAASVTLLVLRPVKR